MNLPKRKRNRLKEYDYSQNGAYFITICTDKRRCILSNIVGDGSPVPILTEQGVVAKNVTLEISKKYPDVNVDKYIIMPNHVHLLLSVKNGTGNPSPTIGKVIGWYKYNITKQVNLLKETEGNRLFQRSFYDHVIRNENDYKDIWEYIEHNFLKWKEDCFYSVEL